MFVRNYTFLILIDITTYGKSLNLEAYDMKMSLFLWYFRVVRFAKEPKFSVRKCVLWVWDYSPMFGENLESEAYDMKSTYFLVFSIVSGGRRNPKIFVRLYSQNLNVSSSILLSYIFEEDDMK